MKKCILQSSNYFLKCEFLNKYRSTNIFEKPSVKKVVLYFSLTQIINSLSINKKLTPVDAFYLFYSNFSIFPFVTFNLISGKKDQIEQFDSNIKIVLTKKSDISLFLFKVIRFYKIKNQSTALKKNISKSKLSVNFKYPMALIFNSTTLDFDTENFFRVNLVLKTFSSFKTSKLLLQNSL
jgi:hypothetical protein